MSVQEDFVSRIRTSISNIIRVVEQSDSLVRVALDRGYEQWTDEQLADVIVDGQPLTKAKLLEMVGALQAVKSLMDNQAVPAVNRRAIFNRYRSDV